MMRAHERMSASPGGTHALFAANQSLPFCQTASSTRSSFASRPGDARPLVGGCAANGGRPRRLIAGVATSVTDTAAGGMPVTVSRCATREVGSFTDTTYSVAVGDSDCTGVRLASPASGPYVVVAGLVEPASSSALLMIQSSEPDAAEPSPAQFWKMSAPSTTSPSANPRRGWSAQPGALYDVIVQCPVGSLESETARWMLVASRSEIDAHHRP